MGLFRYRRRTFAIEALMIALAAAWCVPFYLLVVNSLNPDSSSTGSGFGIPSHVSLSAYSEAWQGNGDGTLGGGLVTSAVITFGSMIVLIAVGSVASYVIARRAGRRGSAAYLLAVVGIILPVQLGIIPLFSAFRSAGLLGSYLGMILLYSGLLMPLSVFLYTGFVRALPKQYEESAQVDGASPVRTFVRVVFPLLAPATGTVAILVALVVWNDFFTQLVFLSGTTHQTIPVSIYSFIGAYGAAWNKVFAAVVIAVLPAVLFFLVAQKRLIRGFSGGIKE